jgi:Flp pilus assembly protein TadG
MRDERGSTYLETLIALPVLFAAFVTMMVFARLSVGHVIAQRAASAGVRAAVVILPDDPTYYGTEGAADKQECIKEAVRRVLMVYPMFNLDDVRVEVTGSQSEWAPTTVRVTANFDCHSLIGSNRFFGKMLCCDDRIATFHTEATLAYQAGPLEN